jgi:hypothetical protein
MDQHGRPADHAELHSAYWDLTKSLVYLGGIYPDGVEDSAQEVMLQYMSAGYLDGYNPKLVHKTARGPKTASFPTAFKRYVQLAARNELERQQRRDREVLLCDEPVSHDSVWLDLHGGTTEIDGLPVELSTELERVRRHLSTIVIDGRNLCDVFDAMLELGKEHDVVSGVLLAERLGITLNTDPTRGPAVAGPTDEPSKTAGTRWLRLVREELRSIGFQQLQPDLD